MSENMLIAAVSFAALLVGIVVGNEAIAYRVSHDCAAKGQVEVDRVIYECRRKYG